VKFGIDNEPHPSVQREVDRNSRYEVKFGIDNQPHLSVQREVDRSSRYEVKFGIDNEPHPSVQREVDRSSRYEVKFGIDNEPHPSVQRKATPEFRNGAFHEPLHSPHRKSYRHDLYPVMRPCLRNPARGVAVLGLVLAVSLLVALVLARVLLNDARLARSRSAESLAMEAQFVSQKAKNIFSVVHLCTCNLRGLSFTSTVPVREIMVTSENQPQGRQFGYTQLTTDASGATRCFPNPQTFRSPEDVVWQVGGGELASVTTLRSPYVRLFGFDSRGLVSDPENPGGQLERYRARLVMTFSQAGEAVSRSTVRDPVESDVYLELAGNTVRGCYVPPVVGQAGVCGPAQGQTFATAPTTDLCNPGTASAVTTNATTYDWSCTGINGGANANCQAARSTCATVGGTWVLGEVMPCIPGDWGIINPGACIGMTRCQCIYGLLVEPKCPNGLVPGGPCTVPCGASMCWRPAESGGGWNFSWWESFYCRAL
jgi:hypothetical protein